MVVSRTTLLTVGILLLSLTIIIPAFSQSSKATISGRVVDSAGGVLQGARIDLEPRAASVVSDGQGQFTITNLLPTSYSITVSYVGFSPYTTTVRLEPGQITRVDAVLNVASKNEEIVVTAERPHGEAEAINRELTSDNILQVLPNEVINSLPNTNVADALGRLPSVTLERDEGEGKYVQIRGTEPRLSNVTIDGVNVASSEQSGARQIKLDAIPANLVESVEINKTLSASQDGDAIGGSVNLVTKTAGDKPTWYLNTIGGVTPIFGNRKLYEVDGTLGKRFGANKKLGALIAGSYDYNGRGINDIEPAVGTIQCGADNCGGNPNKPGVSGNAPSFANYSTMDLRDYAYYRERLGFAGSLDYKLSETSGLYMHFLFSHFNNFGDRWVYTPTVNAFDSSPTQGFVDPATNLGAGNMTFNAQIRRPVETIGSLQAGGKHVFTKTLFSWDISVSRSSQEDQGYSSADFGANDPASPINNVGYNVDLSNPNRPKFNVSNGVNVYDPTQYYLQDINFQRSYSAQLNLQAGFALSRSYSLGGHFGTFEFGAKIRNAHKFNDPNEQDYNADTSVPTDASLQMTNFLSNRTDPGYYDKSYNLGPFVDYKKVRAYFNANPNGLITLDANRSILRNDPNKYDVVERVSAGYLMNTIDIGRVRLQTGLRFEGTQENNLGYMVTTDANGQWLSTTPQSHSGSYLDVLPTVQARVRLWNDGAVRAVYGRGISRPNFGDLVPFQSINDRRNTVDFGNPNLKAEHANNFDILFEQYLKPLGVIQAGFYYKQLGDPIVTTDFIASSGTYTGFEVTQPTNAGSAHVAGFEIAYQQRLSFLPGLASGLGISANYGYSTSGTKGVSSLRTDNPALVRQAPNTWNVSPTYDRGRLSMRVGISHNDANIFQYNYSNLNADGTPITPAPLNGTKGPLGDIYLYAHTQVDAQGSFRMYKGLQFIVSGLNLTNEVFGFYQGSPQFPIQREYYKPTYSFGLRWNSGVETK